MILTKADTFSSFSVNDLEKAKHFYTETLGLDVKTEKDMGLSLNLRGQSSVFIYGKPNHQPATFTVLNFRVTDIEKTVDELTEKGVKFEHYDGELKTNSKGIYRETEASNGPAGIAWFKDPAGNYLSVIQERR